MIKFKIFINIIITFSLIIVLSVFLSADKNSGTSSYYKENVENRVYFENFYDTYLYPEAYSFKYVTDYDDPILGKVTAFVLDEDLFENTVSFQSNYDKVYFNNTTKKESKVIEETESMTESSLYNRVETESMTESSFYDIEETETENISSINKNLLKVYDEQLKGSENADLGPIGLLFDGQITSTVIHEINEKTYKEGEYYPFITVSDFIRNKGDVYYFYYIKGQFIVYDLSINIKTGEILLEKNSYSRKNVNDIYFDFIDIPIEEEFPPLPDYTIDYDKNSLETEEITEAEGTNFDAFENMFDDESLSDENGNFDDIEEDFEDRDEYIPEDDYEKLKPIEAIIGEDNYIELMELLYNNRVYVVEYYTSVTIDSTIINIYLKTEKGYLKVIYTIETQEFYVEFDNFMNTATLLRTLEEDYENTDY